MKDKIRLIDFLYMIKNQKIDSLGIDIFISNLSEKTRQDIEIFLNDNKKLGIF